MNNYLNFVLFSVSMFFATFSLPAEIYETMHMNKVYDHLQSDMLILFDIDNTLIEPVQELGSNQWFEHRIKEYVSQGQSKQEALEKALREWTAIQNITHVKLVEPGSHQIVKDLQKKGYSVIGFTTRGLGISTCTIEQLESVNIDFTTTAPTKEEIFFTNGHGILFRGGVLFTAGTDKGKALGKFLDTINCRPASILFINDKLSHLLPVEEYCKQSSLPFIGLRYGYLDEKVENLRTQIADVQFHHFGHILSNDAAERILQESSKVKRLPAVTGSLRNY
jgi:hypothetical protein